MRVLGHLYHFIAERNLSAVSIELDRNALSQQIAAFSLFQFKTIWKISLNSSHVYLTKRSFSMHNPFL